MLRELIEQIELEKMAERQISYDPYFEMMKVAFFDELGLIEKDAGFVKNILKGGKRLLTGQPAPTRAPLKMTHKPGAPAPTSRVAADPTTGRETVRAWNQDLGQWVTSTRGPSAQNIAERAAHFERVMPHNPTMVRGAPAVSRRASAAVI